MKIFFLSFSILTSFAAVAQPKIIQQAVISTTTNIIAPDDEDVSQIQNQGGGGGFNFRNFGDGETKTTTYIKNDLVKTNFKSESFRGTVFRNNTAKTTTTIFEMMGNKMGFVASDDDQAIMRKRADSMMKERAKTDTGGQQRKMRTMEQPAATVAYTEESKKIAGYNCKKAYIVTDRMFGKDSVAVWYTPEIKFEGVSSTGGTSGLGNMGGTNNFDKVNGFVMQYERNMPRGRKMEVKVTKIETDKSVDDKEFVLPKDVEIKTMKEMSEGGGGMMRMMRPS